MLPGTAAKAVCLTGLPQLAEPPGTGARARDIRDPRLRMALAPGARRREHVVVICSSTCRFARTSRALACATSGLSRALPDKR